MLTRTWELSIDGTGGGFIVYATTEDDAERQARRLVGLTKPGATWTLTEVKP